ncbi:MAG: YggT family protein, partial [Candidatus Thiodiazotropha sp. (ex Myrtea spinifera)]|nr:YggT family protein [Candidatus Thiodiazotropha sp. (ex Myrtea spinifera)]
MSGSYLANPMIFLVQTLFGLYILAVLLRFLLQLVHADFFNPISQFLVKATNPPLKILRRFIPGLGGIDLASVILAWLLKAIELL